MDTAQHSALDRFVSAQAHSYTTALSELKSGHKRSHWIWFIFPQIGGLGHSATAKLYAIQNREEALAYLAHELLGPRLIECTQAMLDVTGKSAYEILGHPDDLKFCSSMTLFEATTSGASLFSQALEKYYAGKRDERTLAILKSM